MSWTDKEMRSYTGLTFPKHENREVDNEQIIIKRLKRHIDNNKEIK